MSVDTNFYIGVYLVVDQFIEYTTTRRVCENGHGNGSEKFCGECGTKVKAKKFTRTRRMSCNEAAEEFGFSEDAFLNVDRGDNPHIWVANGGSIVNADSDCDAEINPDTIVAAVDAFHERYARELDLLEENGVEYEMLYGAVVHFN